MKNKTTAFVVYSRLPVLKVYCFLVNVIRIRVHSILFDYSCYIQSKKTEIIKYKYKRSMFYIDRATLN